jgi:anti-sigma-K factor RskA
VSDDRDRLRDEAAAWLLGALDEDEARAFEDLLERSPDARHEVEELRATTDRLPFAAPPLAPPPELRDRIMAVVESEAELLNAAGAAADRPPRPRRRAWWRPAPLVAAACTLLVAGVVAGVLIGGGGGADVRTVAAQVAPDVRGARAHLEMGDGRAELVVDGMPAAGSGRVYQVWLLHRGQRTPVPAGTIFDVDRAGHGVGAVVGDMATVRSVLVSVEPAGGSTAPTTDPVVTASLS